MYEVCIIGVSLVVLIHLVGILLLCKSKNELPNQRFLVLNLAVVEMLCGCYMLMIFSVITSGIEWRVNVLYCVTIFGETLLYTRVRLAVLHIIMDRFMEIYLNIKYPIYVTRKCSISVASLSWIFSATPAATSVILLDFQGRKTAHKFAIYSLLCLDILIFSSAIITYMYFYNT